MRVRLGFAVGFGGSPLLFFSFGLLPSLSASLSSPCDAVGVRVSGRLEFESAEFGRLRLRFAVSGRFDGRGVIGAGTGMIGAFKTSRSAFAKSESAGAVAAAMSKLKILLSPGRVRSLTSLIASL